MRLITLTTALLLPLVAPADDPPPFPPGWLPVAPLAADEPSWSDFRKIDDRIHLYLPGGDQPVDGIYACFVFHSSDPRELARLWNFALVTVPWPFNYDLGHNDKRNGRYKLGHESQDMSLLLRYLDQAAETTGHPELRTVPIVGWLGQNGSHLCASLYAHAPERVLAWSDSFPNRLRNYPELTRNVPFAFAWEISKKELRENTRNYRNDEKFVHDDLSARANTYGFGHGIYSKYNYFAAYLDRCIRARMPDEMPEPGKPVALKKLSRAQGWVGDFDPISEWNPVVPATDPAAADFKYPTWFPDAYAAHSWRAYHSAQPVVKLTGPVVEYRKKDGKWGGPDCGLGYGGERSATEDFTFTAKADPDKVTKVEFFSGDRSLGSAAAEPWSAAGIKLEPGLHTLFAVGTLADGSKSASRPAFLIVTE